MKLDIILPTLNYPHLSNFLESLKYLPFDYELKMVSEGKNWAQAINIGLDYFKNSNNDILICDDDVVFLPETFKDFESKKDIADIIGFKLLYDDNTIQHGGCIIYPNGHILQEFKHEENHELPERFVSHCTTSLIYIKKDVINMLGHMHEFSGEQFEDVDFSLRALSEGFTIYFLDNTAMHFESKTKSQAISGFLDKAGISYRELIMKHLYNPTDNLIKTLLKYTK